MQPPDDGHRACAGVADVGGGAEEGERLGAAPGVFVRRTDEEHDVAAALCVVDVALAGWGAGADRRLRFPVEEVGGDGIVVVAGARRVVLLALLERDEEVVGVGLRVRKRAFTVREGLCDRRAAEGG